MKGRTTPVKSRDRWKAWAIRKRRFAQYLDIPNEPMLPFGYGLSYCDFRYFDVALSADSLSDDGKLTLTVRVSNEGDREGEETVQLYIRDIAGETVRPLRELKEFRKIMLGPGESQTIEFEITEEMLRYHHSDLQYKSDPGRFTAMVGANSRDVQEIGFFMR